jgi:hypothetical protein
MMSRCLAKGLVEVLFSFLVIWAWAGWLIEWAGVTCNRPMLTNTITLFKKEK